MNKSIKYILFYSVISFVQPAFAEGCNTLNETQWYGSVNSDTGTIRRILNIYINDSSLVQAKSFRKIYNLTGLINKKPLDGHCTEEINTGQVKIVSISFSDIRHVINLNSDSPQPIQFPINGQWLIGGDTYHVNGLIIKH